MELQRRVLAVLTAVALASAGCSGGNGASVSDKGSNVEAVTACGNTDCTGAPGPQGPPGPQGEQGPAGEPGVFMGEVKGTVTSSSASKTFPVAGVLVSFEPNVGVTAMTDANGFFTAKVPVGVYTVTFSKSPGIASTSFPNVSVVAGGVVTLNKALAYSPLALKFTSGVTPYAGLGKPVTLVTSLDGATGPVTYRWSFTSGPYSAVPPLNVGADGTRASFTTGLLADLIASGKVNNPPLDIPDRASFVAISPGQAAKMSYVVAVEVNDGTFTQKASATVGTLPFTPGVAETGVLGLPTIVNALATTYDWKLVSKPDGSNAAFDSPNARNAIFTPDKEGRYVIANGADEVLAVTVGKFVGLGKIADSGASCTPDCPTGCANWCSTCHSDYFQPPKAKEWKNSAHGNHFFKFMRYNASGELVWNDSVPAPTADAGVFWSQPGRMTTFEYGMTGAEGSHYGSSCISCHTTGYNAYPLAANAGFDDLMAATGWKFPTVAEMEAAFGGSGATKAPVFTLWNAIPSDLKGLVGMQCESCHGPMNEHAQQPMVTVNGVTSPNATPQGFYNVDSCAACHDRPANHDRIALWRQSGHASRELAIGEGGSTNCTRCHTAQGFKAWADHLFDPAWTPAAGFAPAVAEPITCQACHDPHKTSLRYDDALETLREQGKPQAITLVNGTTISDMGAGASCMVCHNGRKALNAAGPKGSSPHGAAQTDVFLGINAYFVNPSNPSAHVAVADTCVGCHMKLKYAVPGGITPTNTNHTFALDASRTCQQCHANSEAAGIETQFADSLAALNQAITAKINAFLTVPYTLTAQDPAEVAAAVAVTLDQKPVAIEVVGGPHGTASLQFTFATAITDPFDAAATTTKLLVLPASVPGLNTSGNGTIARAAWNARLVVNDSSKGIHNPDFVFEVLANTRAAVNADVLPEP